jgi:chromosome segregation ATPase
LLKLDQNLEDIVKTNKKTEQNLRKKKLKTEAEVEKWVKKYDTEMEEKETIIQEITEEYESIKTELAELEEQYALLTKEREEFLAEERTVQDAHMVQFQLEIFKFKIFSLKLKKFVICITQQQSYRDGGETLIINCKV